MEAKEAYDTLADAEKRRRYDDELRRSGSPLRIARVPEIVRDRSRAHDALAQAGSFVDEFLEGFLPGFPSRRRFRSPEKEIYLQVILSPRESREGGLFPIRFPVRESCPECGSAGLVSDFFCASCFGRGYVSAEREFSLSIPPRTGSGTAVSLSLEDIGLRGVRLLVEVLVDPLLKD
jgi:DnaJ-class molecular chaperone